MNTQTDTSKVVGIVIGVIVAIIVAAAVAGGVVLKLNDKPSAKPPRSVEAFCRTMSYNPPSSAIEKVKTDPSLAQTMADVGLPGGESLPAELQADRDEVHDAILSSSPDTGLPAALRMEAWAKTHC